MDAGCRMPDAGCRKKMLDIGCVGGGNGTAE